MSTAPTARCIAASETVTAVVAPASGPASEPTSAITATKVQAWRPRGESRSSKASDPQPARDATALAMITEPGPTRCGSPAPGVTSSSTPSSGPAIAQTITAARTAPAAPYARTRVRRLPLSCWLAVGSI